MKRYCNLFFLLFFFLFIRNTAKCTNGSPRLYNCHLNTTPHKSHASPVSSMKEKKPHSGYTVLLFRAGLEGKSISFVYKAILQSVYIPGCIKVFDISSSPRLKFIISSSDCLVLSAEFLSAFSSHAPPGLC